MSGSHDGPSILNTDPLP
jgi:hypothetical protein